MTLRAASADPFSRVRARWAAAWCAATPVGLGLCPLAGAAADAPPAAAAAPERVFIVFDIDMEVTSTAADPQAAALDAQRGRAYDDLTRQLQAWGAAQGVGVETGVYARNRKIDLRGRSYDYLIVEKITQQAQSDTPTGLRVSDRKWSVTALDVRAPHAKTPKKLGAAEYVSDGVACFGRAAQAAEPAAERDQEAACQQAHLAILSQHLQWIRPEWPAVQRVQP
ncbi:MAG: hypothetical protein AB9M53_02115 [Leptothrix sp. (in: b-proteobacteria)]